MARRKKVVKGTPGVDADHEGLPFEPEEVTATPEESEEEPEQVELEPEEEEEPQPKKVAKKKPVVEEDEEGEEEEAAAEEEIEEEVDEDIDTPDFGSWFNENLRAPQQVAPQPPRQQGPPPGFAVNAPMPAPDITAEQLINNPNLIRQEAMRIAQQTMVPYQQALNGLMYDLRQKEHGRAVAMMQDNYRKATREEPLYKNKKFKEALDNSMAFLVQQAWMTGDTRALQNPILPKVIAYALKASVEATNPRPRRVAVRGGEVATSRKVSGQKGRPALTPEQEILRKRLGLTYEQWVENETAADKHRSGLDW